MLLTGEVAGLFPREELDALLNDLRPLMRAQAPGECTCVWRSLPLKLNPWECIWLEAIHMRHSSLSLTIYYIYCYIYYLFIMMNLD